MSFILNKRIHHPVLRFTITVYRRPIFIIKGTIQVSGIMLFLDNENPLLADKDMVNLRCLGRIKRKGNV
jgi:hypothetical protein